MADDKSSTAPTEDELQRTERAYGVLKGIFKGLKPDDILQVAEAFKQVGMSFDDLSEANIDKIVESMHRMGDEKLGTQAAKTADKMISSINGMLKTQKVKNDAFVSAYLRRTEIELRMAKIAKQKIEAEEKGFRYMMEAKQAEFAVKTGEWAKKNLGADSKMTQSIMQNAGWIGLVVAILMMANQTLKTFHERMQKSSSALTSVGLMGNMTVAKYSSLALNVGAHLTSITSLGFVASEAMKLWETASKNQILSLGLLEMQQKGYNTTLDNVRVQAVKSAMDMTFELNRLSVAMFGSTNEAGAMTDIANKFGMAGMKNIRMLGGLLEKTTGTAQIQGTTMLELMNTMGDKTIYFKKGTTEALHSLIPLTNGLANFRERTKMSAYALNDMTKGIQSMVKGADSILYMALKGSGGMSFESRLKQSMEMNPLQKSMESLQMLYQKTGGGEKGLYTTSLALQQFMPGMSELARKNLLDFATSDYYKATRASLTGDTAKDALKISDALAEQGKKLSETATAQLMGMSLEEQTVDLLRKLLMSVVEGLAGILTKLGMGNFMKNINEVRETANSANSVTTKIYQGDIKRFT